MSLSFACPSCKAQMEVADELAGQSGQCPRCQHVFIVPSPTREGPKPIVAPKAVPATTTIPPADPWAQEKPQPPPGARPRRARAVPPAPSGPLWPWLIAVPLALVVAVLLFSSFIVLVAWRKPLTNPPGVALKVAAPVRAPVQRVTVGRLEGVRAFLHNGVFQIHGELTDNDMPDLDNPICRAKDYDVELIANRTYVIELDSVQFDPLVRLEEFNGLPVVAGRPGLRKASFRYTPLNTRVFTVYATSIDPAFGPFTLTVREENLAKPFVP